MHPTRRLVLGGGAVLVPALVGISAADASGQGTNATRRAYAVPGTAVAAWVRAENSRPGDGAWLHGHTAGDGELEAYASTVSATRGDVVSVFASTTSPTLTAKVYRMGYYQGLGARRIATKTGLKAHAQPMPVPDEYGTVDCAWSPTFTLSIDERYPPGQYLIRLENEHGQYRFVPLLIRDDTSRATYVYLSAVTTWQAYNSWGGFSLYRETNPFGTTITSNARRAVRVSFNRPYDVKFANGAADFIGNEFPLLFLCEQLGLDLAYWTDVDLDLRGERLHEHKVLLSLGHDEYYSPSMRRALTSAIERGVNVAFFGANFSYRKIRFEPGNNGADRLMINYRSSADPITASNPSLATVNWSQYPSDQPESAFSGSLYGGADGVGSLVVADSSSWLWHGTGLSDGAVLAGALGGEFNRFDPAAQNPSSVQIFAHSPVAGGAADITYTAQPGRGGVFCTGTGYWIYRLSDAPRMIGGWVPRAIPGVTADLTTATVNVLALFARGPAGDVIASIDNTALFY